MAKIFMQNIFKCHGMPKSIVSDKDPRMTSLFWKGLFDNLGTTLMFSSAYHPQTDGQSKEANSTVLNMLKCYVSEHKAKWESLWSCPKTDNATKKYPKNAHKNRTPDQRLKFNKIL